jgi:hypothetical protein
VRSVIAPPHLAQKQMPVSNVGPLDTRAGLTMGLRDFNRACTASNVSRSINGGTAMMATSLSGFFSRSLCERVLNLCSPI